MSPDDAPAPVARTKQARHAAATIAVAAVFAFVSLLSSLGGTAASVPATVLEAPGVEALVVEAAAEPAAGAPVSDDAAHHRILRSMWVATLSVVALAPVVPAVVAWPRRRGAEPRPDRAHPGRTQAVRPPPAVALRLLA